MSRATRAAAAVLLLVPVPGFVGCGPSKNAPNPDLQVPDIPASGNGSKDVLKEKKDKKDR